MISTKIIVFCFFGITILFSIIGLLPVYAVASLTLSPTTGNVGTTVTAKGTGYTPSGSLSQVQNNHANTIGFTGSILAQKFTGLPGNTHVTGLVLNVSSTGLGTYTVLQDNEATSTGLPTDIIAQKFTGLPGGATITHMALKINAVGTGKVRAKIYGSNVGGGLLGESAEATPSGTGVLNMSLTATVPANGTIYAAWQISDPSTTIYRTVIGGIQTWSETHAYGSGPSIFTFDGTNGALYYVSITYTGPTPQIITKMYGSNVGGGLLGESSIYNVTTVGFNTIPITATVPANGTIYTAFESNNLNTILYRTVIGGTQTWQKTHTFGSGPSIFTYDSTNGAQWYENLTYNVSPIPITIRYDGSTLTTTPPTINTNSTGGFTGTFLAPISLIGSNTVNASDNNGLFNTKTFTITIPTTSSTITGSVLYSTSSLTPSLSYSAPPSSITATKNQLYRNNTLVATNSIFDTVPGSVATPISSIGETMVGPSSYFVNTTTTDGANSWVTKSNTVILTPGTSPPNNGTKCGINGCPIKQVVTYSAHRNSNFSKLHITAIITPTPFNTECSISNGTFGNTHRWYNYTGLSFLNFNASVPQHDSAGYICYGSGVLFSGLSPGNQTVVQAGANIFNNSFGAIIGIPAGMFIVVLIGSLANQRTGPIYLIASLAVAGILATIGFFVLDTGWWAMSLIFGMLGLLVGRKVF